MRFFNCTNCNQVVYFDNVICEGCASPLAFRPDTLSMIAFEILSDGSWQELGSNQGQLWKPCRNYNLENVCNWVLAHDDYNSSLCAACLTTQIIPPLTSINNKRYWYLLEKAKRHLFYTLLSFGLPIPNRFQDPERGLSFRFMEDQIPYVKVVTGHEAGVITVNIAEADDAHRAAVRKAMGEPYRTLLGHFRHESGHFYWDYLVANSVWLQPFREIFGDEQQDYNLAMQTYYSQGPQPNWAQDYISAYASAHPWEDWAECWAHYLHIRDALDTAKEHGFSIQPATSADSINLTHHSVTGSDFYGVLYDQWLPLAQFLNSMNRSLGQDDSYPFLISDSVAAKLALIDQFVKASGNTAGTN